MSRNVQSSPTNINSFFVLFFVCLFCYYLNAENHSRISQTLKMVQICCKNVPCHLIGSKGSCSSAKKSYCDFPPLYLSSLYCDTWAVSRLCSLLMMLGLLSAGSVQKHCFLSTGRPVLKGNRSKDANRPTQGTCTLFSVCRFCLEVLSIFMQKKYYTVLFFASNLHSTGHCHIGFSWPKNRKKLACHIFDKGVSTQLLVRLTK